MDLLNKPIYYVNTAQVNVNNFDIAFSLGNKKMRENNELSEQDIECSIIMSPQHAKAFANIVNGAIEYYERTFGEIILEPIIDKTHVKE